MKLALALLLGSAIGAAQAQESRRGLLVEGSWVASTVASASECAALKEKIDALKAEAGFGLRQAPSVDAPVVHTCFINFLGDTDFADLVQRRFPELEIEQDAFVDAYAPPASWGLDRIDQTTLPLDNAEFTPGATGQGVEVYIVDTGVNDAHEDFGGRAEQKISFHSGSANVDDNGHGTHCAGTAAGTKYGIARDAKIIGVKVLGSNGGTNFGVIQGVNWAVNNAARPGVISMSLGGGASSSLDKAVRDAAEKMIVVVAAGNESQNACNVSPARAGGRGKEGSVITVGSTTRTDTMSSFSNWGSCVDVFAPGSAIRSAWIGSTTATRTISGTSMATPHVAGVAAVLLEKHNFDRLAAIAELFETATPGRITQIDNVSPNELLRVPAATAAEPTPTSAPTGTAVEEPSPSPPPPPPANEAWTCPQAWLGTDDGCDCGCGAVDPDCLNPFTALYCRGRGARWWQVCLESTNECANMFSLLEEVEEGATPPPTIIDQPANKDGVENGVEVPPPITSNPGTEDLPSPGDDGLPGDQSTAGATGITIGIVGGVCAVVGVVAVVVVRQRRASEAAVKHGPSPAPTAMAVAPGGYQLDAPGPPSDILAGNPRYGGAQPY